MKISAKAEYACLAVLDLALLRDKPDPVRVAEVAERNEIPERFLIQILLQLKGAGYVQSVRGAAGGYRLAVPPETISVWDVIRTVDGSNGGEGHTDSHQGGGWRVLREVWRNVNEIEEVNLKKIDFGQLVIQATQQDANMFHI